MVILCGFIDLVKERFGLKTDKELVTIIVPVYNSERYLPQCIENLMIQTYENLEIILIDDGSQDYSLRICETYVQKDNRIKVIHQDNMGVSATRNVGIEEAKGKYICFVDSDDYVEKEYVYELVNGVSKNVMPFCGYTIDTYKKTKLISTKRIREADRVTAVKDDMANLFHQGYFAVIWNKIYDVTVLRENRIKFDSNLSLGEDLLFNINYIQSGITEFVNINKSLYHYERRGKESLDHKYRPDFLKIQERLYEELIMFSDKYNISIKQKNIIYFDFFAALIVSIDNCYVYRKNLSKRELESIVNKAKNSIEKHNIVGNIHGGLGLICRVRYYALKKGFYWADYMARRVIKKIIGL